MAIVAQLVKRRADTATRARESFFIVVKVFNVAFGILKCAAKVVNKISANKFLICFFCAKEDGCIILCKEKHVVLRQPLVFLPNEVVNVFLALSRKGTKA